MPLKANDTQTAAVKLWLSKVVIWMGMNDQQEGVVYSCQLYVSCMAYQWNKTAVSWACESSSNTLLHQFDMYTREFKSFMLNFNHVWGVCDLLLTFCHSECTCVQKQASKFFPGWSISSFLLVCIHCWLQPFYACYLIFGKWTQVLWVQLHTLVMVQQRGTLWVQDESWKD